MTLQALPTDTTAKSLASQLQSNGLISQQRGRGSFVTGIKNTGDLRVAIILSEWATTLRQPHETLGHDQLLEAWKTI